MLHDASWQHPAETYRNGIDVLWCQWLRAEEETRSCVLFSELLPTGVQVAVNDEPCFGLFTVPLLVKAGKFTNGRDKSLAVLPEFPEYRFIQ